MKKKVVALALLLTLLCGLCLTGCAEEKGEIVVPDIENFTQFEILDNEAMAFMKKMGIGWNLGNTFDATQDSWPQSREMDIEKSWVGVLTSRELIAAVHAAGFSTIRIPTSWHNHVSGDDFEISEAWIARVQEVVDWALEEGMYVILNTHHDVGANYYYPDDAHRETSLHYVECVWSQIAERFRDYDEHLIFESLNEPRLVGTDYEWSFRADVPECVRAAEIINEMNQKFVDVVRASGGQNANRYLMVPGYAASPENAVNGVYTLPTDTADNRIIVSIHAYTPYSFALDRSGTDTFTIATTPQTSDINRFITSVYNEYVAKGVPVVIGEFGALRKGDNLQERVNFAAYYAAAASARNIPCVWWDNHAFTGNGELFGLIDRKNCEWKYPEIVDALMKYAGYDKIPAKE